MTSAAENPIRPSRVGKDPKLLGISPKNPVLGFTSVLDESFTKSLSGDSSANLALASIIACTLSLVMEGSGSLTLNSLVNLPSLSANATSELRIVNVLARNCAENVMSVSLSEFC